MTSKQVMLAAAILALTLASGCSLLGPGPMAEPLVSPYAQRHVWAVAPLRNESGSLQPDGAQMADHLARQLENAANLDVLPVNRVIDAMAALKMQGVMTHEQARQLLQTLGSDGLIVGTITAYDPYDPPKLGLALELFVSPEAPGVAVLNPRELSAAATDTQARPSGIGPDAVSRPTTVSAVFDGGDPNVRAQMQRYANQRGTEVDPNAWHRYRTSMDLYSEFVSYVMSWRLLDAETKRLAGPAREDRR